MTTSQLNNEIQEHINQAFNLAIEHVEKLARKILEDHSDLEEFVMAMGGVVFAEPYMIDLKPAGEKYSRNCLGLDDRDYFEELDEFIGANRNAHAFYRQGSKSNGVVKISSITSIGSVATHETQRIVY